MIYTWRCKRCDEKVEVTRRLSEYRKQPEFHEHLSCGGALFTRILTLPTMIIVNESEDQYWKDDNYHQ